MIDLRQAGPAKAARPIPVVLIKLFHKLHLASFKIRFNIVLWFANNEHVWIAEYAILLTSQLFCWEICFAFVSLYNYVDMIYRLACKRKLHIKKDNRFLCTCYKLPLQHTSSAQIFSDGLT